jgi:uncharacterized protein (TIGR00295 family)
MLDEKNARELLKTLKAPKEVVEHSEAVHDTCMNLIDLLRERNRILRINRRLVAVGSLLHDIGRTKSQDINHGIVGAQIIRDLNVKNDPDLEKVAKICERHLGGGISKKEAQKLGLPPGDYLPKSIEEKIIAYCDNMIDDANGPVVHDPAWAALDYEKKHGKNSEPAKRVRELNRFFERMLTD